MPDTACPQATEHKTIYARALRRRSLLYHGVNKLIESKHLERRILADRGIARPKLGFGYGFGTETAKFIGFGPISVKAVTRILVSAWIRLQP